jgi:hypothetical protein
LRQLINQQEKYNYNEKTKTMKKVIQLSICLLFFGAKMLWAQNLTYELKGKVKDARNGEELIGATIGIQEMPGMGTTSNLSGDYLMRLPKGTYTLVTQFTGYQPKKEIVTLDTNKVINFLLVQKVDETAEIIITDEREDKNVKAAESGVIEFKPTDVEQVPVLFGEKDIVKVAQMQPGIKTAGEGNSGFYVRGGGTDQNLVLLDGATLYNPTHLFGLFSTFNSDVVDNVKIYKGAFPAQYGGRASAIMDVSTKEGDKEGFGAEGGIGLISSRLAINGPIVKNKGSFIVSARRSYIDLFTRQVENFKDTKLSFYDLNGRFNYHLNQKNKVYFSAYSGKDNLGLSAAFGLDWGNRAATLGWDKYFNDKITLNSSLVYSNYNYNINFSLNSSEATISSVIKDFKLNQNIDHQLNSKNKLKYGYDLIHHTFNTGTIDASEGGAFNSFEAEDKLGLEGGLFIQNEQQINKRIQLNYGLRYSFFNTMGPSTVETYDEYGNVLTSKKYDSGESIKTYGGFEPRFSGRFTLNETSSLKLGLSKNYQYVHMLSNATASNPTDNWVLSSSNVKPQSALQGSIGYFKNYKENMYQLSIETYYKKFNNLVDYRDGADLFLNASAESQLLFGKGRAYGIEFLMEKKKGDLTGWLGYTLSRSAKTFDQINNGEEFSARQDRRHDFSAVAMYKLNKKVSVSSNFIIYTGDAITYPSGKYTLGDGTVVPYYAKRNGDRMPVYHRLDFGLTLKGRETNKFSSNWAFSLYNSYGRRNAFSVTFQEDEDNPGETEAIRTSLFRWIPSVSYNFKFK